MANFIAFNRDQAFLLPPDMKAWLPEDDLAHFVVAAVERVPVGAFEVPARAGGKPQYHPRLMLALLVYSYANVFSRLVGSSGRRIVTSGCVLLRPIYIPTTIPSRCSGD
jgi:hypothetical protein